MTQASREARCLGPPSRAGGSPWPAGGPVDHLRESRPLGARGATVLRPLSRCDVAVSSMPPSYRSTWGGSASICPHSSASTIALLIHPRRQLSSTRHRMPALVAQLHLASCVCNQRSLRDEMSSPAGASRGGAAVWSAVEMGFRVGPGGAAASRRRAHPVPTSHAVMRRSATRRRSAYDGSPGCGAVCYGGGAPGATRGVNAAGW